MKNIRDVSFNSVQYSCYSLRVDIPPRNSWDTSGNPYFNLFYNFLAAKFKYYIVGREKAPDSLKPHFQCLCLHPSPYITASNLLKIRNEIKKRFGAETKQPVSLCKSWSPLGLFIYVQKDGALYTNMPREMMVHLENLSSEYKSTREHVLNRCGKQASSLNHLSSLLLTALLRRELSSAPRKTEFWKLALQHGLISHQAYYEEFYAPRL